MAAAEEQEQEAEESITSGNWRSRHTWQSRGAGTDQPQPSRDRRLPLELLTMTFP